MKLHVENFAKIKEADIEINGITVIAGENNTGKSTIGKILYCLYQGFHDLHKQVAHEKLKSIASIFKENKQVRDKWDFFLEPKEYKRFIIGLRNSGIDGYISYLNQNEIELDADTREELIDAFSFDSAKLEELIVYEIFRQEFSGQIRPIMINDRTTNVTLSIKNKEKEEIENIDLYFSDEKIIINEKIDLYKEAIYIDNPYIMNHVYKSSDKEFDEQMEMFELLGIRRKMLFHNNVLDNKLSKSFSEINESLIEKDRIEQKLNKIIGIIQDTLKGDLVEKENRFVFYDKSLGGEIELLNLSTGIKSFAIILKLIENHDLKKDSIIVLDEPEVHLHPKWQLVFAEILVLLQKEFNLNIVLTSHSPYFINAIEVYSASHEIADKCKYYLADLNEENTAFFEDVTINTEKIYKKLAEPLRYLNDLKYGNK